MSSSSSSSRKVGRGGGGRGRGRGGSGRRGGGGRGRSNKRSEKTSNGAAVGINGSNTQNNEMPLMRDEEVLIAFMPYLKGDHQEATNIHELYQSNNDQQAFLRAAREFLTREASQAKSSSNGISNAQSSNNNGFESRSNTTTSTMTTTPTAASSSSFPTSSTVHTPPSSTNFLTMPSTQMDHSINPQPTLPGLGSDHFNHRSASPNQLHALLRMPPPKHEIHDPNHISSSSLMESIEQKMNFLFDDDDPVVVPPVQSSTSATPIGTSSVSYGSNNSTTHQPPIGSTNPSAFPSPHRPAMQHEHFQPSYAYQSAQNPVTPPRNTALPLSFQDSSPFSTLFRMNSGNSHTPTTVNNTPNSYQNFTQASPATGSWNRSPPPPPPPGVQSVSDINIQPPSIASRQHNIPVPKLQRRQDTTQIAVANTTSFSDSNSAPPEASTTETTTTKTTTATTTTTTTTTTTDQTTTLEQGKPTRTISEQSKSTKKEYQPKRLWTRLEEQPGRLLANDVPAMMGQVLDLRPRQELTAKWMLPLSYLRQRSAGKNVNSARDALTSLAVGLFRRGCTENGSQASIVSKEILTPAGESRSDYPFTVDKNTNTVIGSVPFYSPRTPGHVVFRLYWQDDPLTTLATGPTLNVRVTEEDFESSIRFILSNFKAKKVNPTSLSSLNSFALVLDQFQLPPTQQTQHLQQQLEGAGRAVWGCICEARKVLDACSSEYTKTIVKLEKLEESVEDLKVQVEEEESSDNISSDQQDAEQKQQEPTPTVVALREKQKALMSGRASCERKWRDSQLAFASILKSVVTNPSMPLLLRRELITKLRLEFELWCPLCEEFAVPGDSDANMWYEPLQNLPHSITAEHYSFCTEARSKMQIRILGFVPNTTPLDSILFATRGRNRQMNPGAVSVFNQLSGAMGHLYQDFYTTAERIHQEREIIRGTTEKFVQMSKAFPPGTKVVVFGSSANGFGSPKSDLDMCLQLPPGSVLPKDDEDQSGAKAMGAIAQILEQNGMKDVDTARLTARIPVIKFNFQRPLSASNPDSEDAYMECDLSMHNPLAVLNTSLLRTYAEINPMTRVLASIIKRWAKARDINNPARHTLSSYGYIIMLLHFLTYHQRTGNGLVSPVAGPDGNQNNTPNLSTPLLPNLQWMDNNWPNAPPGTPYKELMSQPRNVMPHPFEENTFVNTYFYHPAGPIQLDTLQRLFPGQDLSLAILLASFFRYYAFDFDYKRHVVSLHSTVSRGLVEREVKAELDGWRNYSAALTIEDPFETFYDVAHVLRGGYYHRIRREFAVAYSKIADVASGKTNDTWNGQPIDLASMNGMDLVNWICEPVSTERDESST